eukprot:COSAG04_NODE_27015_length_287_cov_1.925532_1_plen_62_part_10
MFGNTAITSNVSILNNVFYQSVPYEAAWWMDDLWGHTPGWGHAIREDANIFWQTEPELGKLV